MAKIMLARDGHESWYEPGAARDYVRFCLGRKERDAFLTELSPIPAGRASDREGITRFAELDDKLAAKLEQRRDNLKQLLKLNVPQLIICYGRTREKEFAEYSISNGKQYPAKSPNHRIPVAYCFPSLASVR